MLRVAFALILLVLSACAEEPRRHPRAIDLPSEPFLIGSPDQYREAKVHEHRRSSQKVYVCSDGRMLVVLSAACPHDDCGIVYDSLSNQFKCPCCARRFTDMGLPRGSPPGKLRSLRRLHIELTGDRDDPASELRVFPQRPYVQEKNEWSYRYSLYLFEEE